MPVPTHSATYTQWKPQKTVFQVSNTGYPDENVMTHSQVKGRQGKQTHKQISKEIKVFTIKKYLGWYKSVCVQMPRDPWGNDH